LIDYKALVGDPSDNIKGVLGIGPKTATEILTKYGTLEKALLAKDDPKLAKLTAASEVAQQNKILVTLRHDAPIGVEDLSDLEFKPDPLGAIEYLRGFGFESLVKRLTENGNGRKEKPKPKTSPKPEADPQGRMF